MIECIATRLYVGGGFHRGRLRRKMAAVWARTDKELWAFRAIFLLLQYTKQSLGPKLIFQNEAYIFSKAYGAKEQEAGSSSDHLIYMFNFGNFFGSDIFKYDLEIILA